jgi:hypothetical protein
MPEQHSQADEAARYVLGQLSPKARHEFEVQLTQSAELRALVQELEEGVEAMARAVPQRPPPLQTWAAIEKAIAQDVRSKVVTPVWSNWWRNGWVAAAACLLVFVSYAWWPQRKANPAVPTPSGPVEVAVTHPPPVELVPFNPGVIRPEIGRPTNVTTAALSKPTPAATNPELASLRWQITALQSQLEKLSEVVSQQKAILTEPGRFKFFPLANSPTGTDGTSPPPLSPGLQRAIAYAMARDLGWLPRTTPGNTPNNSAVGPVVTTVSGIDFVEFNKAQNSTLATTAGTQSQTEEPGAQAPATPISVQPSGSIPGYLRNDLGKELVLAFDPTIVSRGSTLGFWSGTPNESHQLIGTALTGDNPMVVTLPTDGISGDLTITANPASGPSNVIGQFYIFRYSQPEVRSNQSP